MFNPSQAAVPLVPETERGKGYGAQELHQKHQERVVESLGTINPDLRSRAFAATKALVLAQGEYEAMKIELRRVCKDFTADALALLEKQAREEIAKDLVGVRKAVEALQAVEPVSVAPPAPQPTPAAEPQPNVAAPSLEQAENRSKRRARK